ncbi:SHOCT domain-containing protein [Actinocorallia aurea]
MALIVVGVIAAVRYLGHDPRAEGLGREEAVRRGPQEVLSERCARGEIGTEEYRERMAELRER